MNQPCSGWQKSTVISSRICSKWPTFCGMLLGNTFSVWHFFFQFTWLSIYFSLPDVAKNTVPGFFLNFTRVFKYRLWTQAYQRIEIVTTLYLTVFLTQCKPEQYNAEKHNTGRSRTSACHLILLLIEERRQICCVASCCAKSSIAVLAILALSQQKSPGFFFLLRTNITMWNGPNCCGC